MKIFSLKEFAHNLYNTGNTQEMEFAKEILGNLDFVENSRHDEICEDLDTYAKGRGEPIKQVEWLGDRSNLLEEIEDHLTNAGYVAKGTDDTADEINKLIDLVLDMQAALVVEETGKPALEYDL